MDIYELPLCKDRQKYWVCTLKLLYFQTLLVFLLNFTGLKAFNSCFE